MPPVRSVAGIDEVDRRGFMKLLGASLALAGLDGCTRMPASNILPYAHQPELTPGVAQYYATSMVLDGFATGLLVETHEGRPTKIEGHPDHPASLGAAGVFEQASVLELYDPHRAWAARHDSQSATWDEVASAFAPDQLRRHLGARGEGLFLLLEPTSSPLEGELLDHLRNRYPAVSTHFYAPLARSSDAFLPQYELRDADVILAVDADFLASGPFHLRYARQFAERRRPESSQMNRCYAIESSVTVTGTAADHRLALRPADIETALEQLLAAVSGSGAAVRSGDGSHSAWIAAVARDLRAHAGRSVAIPGRYLTPWARSLTWQVNQALGNVGRTIWFSPSPLLGAGDDRHSIASLAEALRAGAVDTLVCIGGNPSYASAGALDLAGMIRRVRQSLYLGLYENETARDCRWMVPALHFLESWGDARAYDGTLSIVQPLVQPLHGGKTTGELLSALEGASGASAYELLRESWRRRRLVANGNDFEGGWQAAVGRGFVEGTAFARGSRLPAAPPHVDLPRRSPIDVVFRPHPRVHDGRFANNTWLQELPDPVTTLTWDNAAHLSAVTAARFGIASGDIVDIHVDDRSVHMPALIVPGHPADVVTLHFGYGRLGSETVARGVGVNVYPLWRGDEFVAGGAEISRVESARAHAFAMTQPHRTLETSTPARATTLDRYADRTPSRSPRALTLYQPPASLPDGAAPQQWAMTIDLGACIGCGACMVACQAENNVPVVGREQVLLGREMHWLRIDWYAAESGNETLAISQPMLCQHCEKAPCEYVCPVEATVHSRDGLNEMVYNRCVGTRFCSNNCPYQVRRFNWFDFNAALSDTERLVKNPDVTVRERGVMEKCTFCVQRIREAEIAARLDGHPLRGDDVQTACQQACPTRAIVFGSLTEPDGGVVRARSSARAYAVLEDFGTEPRVRYLARVRNPNPDLEPHT